MISKLCHANPNASLAAGPSAQGGAGPTSFVYFLPFFVPPFFL